MGRISEKVGSINYRYSYTKKNRLKKYTQLYNLRKNAMSKKEKIIQEVIMFLVRLSKRPIS